MKKIILLMVVSLNVMAWPVANPIKEIKERCETAPNGQTYCYEVYE